MVVQTQGNTGEESTSSLIQEPAETGIYLYWLPLGAGGSYVKLNGRIFELVQAELEKRLPLDLYHTALKVRVPEGLFVVENCWPIPNADGSTRGVVVEGPVFSRRFRRLSALRYEVRLWRDGVIADIAEAVASPQCLSRDPRQARRLLELADSVPPLVWGRDQEATGDMWNSNSVISYLLARSGVPTDGVEPPPGGRAPGWHAGLELARRAGHLEVASIELLGANRIDTLPGLQHRFDW
jgi:hypothetical protein